MKNKVKINKTIPFLFLILSSLFIYNCALINPGNNSEIADAQNLILINEVNTSGNDWVELYNPEEEKIDISGFNLSDNYDDLTKWQFPERTIIPGKAYMVVDFEALYSGYSVDFRIKQGEPLILTTPKAKTVVDKIDILPDTCDGSYGRKTDGSLTFVFFDSPTKGFKNFDDIVDGLVFINELIVNPLQDIDDWVELYNASDSPIDISGYNLSDRSDDLTKWPIADNTIMAPKSYFVIYCNGEDTKEFPNFKLEVGETLILSSRTGNAIVDKIDSLPSTNPAYAYGRETDGSPVFKLFDVPTKGTPNSG